MSRKSDREFWASRMQTRWRIINLRNGELCEVSANRYYEALANLRWRKEDCIGVNLGKKKQLATPKWYELHDLRLRKDEENE